MSKMIPVKKTFMNLLLCLLIAGFCGFQSINIWAEDEEDVADPTTEEGAEEGTEATKAAIYLPIKPQFVVNYGAGARLKYLKAMVTVRVGSSAGANSVRHHLPHIRNNLVLLFASQTDETLSSQDGKEAMRQAAITEIRELLSKEDQLPPEDIMDVLFNSLTWH